ncbi:MAG: hypothetical protein HZB14_02565 [Actinobacteria bacterium]|nr:hypothetical protein [Actinomycetota bacterium]
MGRGRFTLAFVIVLLSALFLAACGDDKPTAGSAGGSTSATGASGEKSGDSSSKDDDSNSNSKNGKSSSDSDSSKSKSSKSDDDSSNSSSKSKSKSNSDSESTKKSPGVYKPSAGTEKQVQDAAEAMGNAIERKDVDYLCGKAYSAEYVKNIGGASACRSKVADQVARYDSYDMKVTAVNFLNPKQAQVYLDLSFTVEGKKTESEPAISFKLEGGDWKYFIYTGE